MRKSQEILGLPVLVKDTGKNLGIVVDLVISPDQKIAGFFVEGTGWLRRRRYLPWSKVMKIGTQGITVDGEDVFAALPKPPYQCLEEVRGCSVETNNGNVIGTIQNVYFLDEVGTMVGYELSDGWLNDLRHGRKLLKMTVPMSGNDEAIVISAQDGCVEELR